MTTIQQAAINAKQLATGKEVEPLNLIPQVHAPDEYPTLDYIDHPATQSELKPHARLGLERISKDGVGTALRDTPMPSLPNSPRM